MINWAEPHFLYLLILVPIFMLAIIIANQRLKKPFLLKLIRGLDPKVRTFRSVLLILTVFLSIIAAARPRWGEKLEIVKGRGVDIILGLDLSRSMNATDIEPDRITKAKTMLLDLLSRLSGNRVGLIGFAGDGWILCPLTTDLEAVKLFLDIAEPGMVPIPGTNLARVLSKSLSLFEDVKDRDQALILLTDGENLTGDPLPLLKNFKEKRIRIFTIGIGSIEGSTIPEYDQSGNFTGYKKDSEAKLVYSRLNERLLLLMAKTTGGRYVRAESRIEPIIEGIKKLKKGELNGEEFVRYEERYQYFLLAALILLILALFLPDRLPRLLLIFIFPLSLRADVGSWMRKGNRLYREGRFEEAVKSYEQAQVLEPDNVKIRFNKGCVLYKVKRYDEAEAEFQLGLLGDRRLKEISNFNIGNVRFRKGDLKGAIETYIQTLLLNPYNIKAKRNLEFCQRLLEELKRKPPPPDTSQAKKPKKEKRSLPEIKLNSKPRIPKTEAMRLLKMLDEKEKKTLKQRFPRKEERVDRDW